MKTLKHIFILLLVITFSACELGHPFKSRKRVMHEIPPLAVFAAIVDFRMEQSSWPVSQQDFINKGVKYYKAFKDFPYQTAEFIVKDSNNMTLHFRDHINRKPVTYKNFDLNNYGGWATFYKEKDKFIWKIKMY